ncbi:MAG: GNAT family N-acetyltransferase [Acidobacteriota bacterium]
MKTHETLLRDAVRNRAFYEALRLNVTADSVVLDIGSGVGIWAITAAKLGAKKVVAIEMDRMLIGVIKALAAEHGVSDRIEVICGNSFDVSLPKEFDIVVSETIGYLGYDENIVAIMADARTRFLKDGGSIIPETIALYAAAGRLKVRSETIPVGLDFDLAFLDDLNHHSPRALKRPEDIELLTDPACLIETDLRIAVEKPLLSNLSARCDPLDAGEADDADCFAVWVESRLTSGVSLSTRETTSWLPNIFRVRPPSKGCAAIEFTLSLDEHTNRWAVTFSRSGRDVERQEYSPAIAASVMLAMPAITLRPATDADNDFLYDLYASTRSDEIAMFGWDELQAQAFLKMQFDVQTQAYQMQYPEAEHNLILADGATVGRTIASRGGENILFIDIAVLTPHRGRGIGTHVINKLRNESVEFGRPLILHVNKTNLRARQLYERLDFLITGETELVFEMTFTLGAPK